MCEGITPFTRSRRVTFSRTSVCSWSTFIKPRPRRPVQRSSPTKWRLAVSRTRYVAFPSNYPQIQNQLRFSGCSRASCCTGHGEATGDHCRRARCCRPGGVNNPYTSLSLFTPLYARSGLMCCVVLSVLHLLPLPITISPYVYPMSCMLSTIIHQANHALMSLPSRISINGCKDNEKKRLISLTSEKIGAGSISLKEGT